MSKKKDTWARITKNLESKVTRSEFKTWFSNISLERLSPDLAVIHVPNKFVANWLHENYLIDIQNSFKSVLRQSPEIQFCYERTGKTKEPIQAGLDSQTPKSSPPPNLNPSMTFDRFITGDCNRFAYTSALEVAKGSTRKYNPLFIYSPAGLGKSHLLHAIGNYRTSKQPSCRIGCSSSDSFTSDFTFSIRNGKLHDFREKYRNLDLLLFDDIHLLVNRKKTQEEFLFIFKELFSDKKQIVITSKRPPTKLSNMNSQLTSRLGSGILTDIQFPDKNTKIKIIKKRAKEDNIQIPDDVLFFFANSSRDIKTLIENIVRLEAYTSLNSGDVNISMVKTLNKSKNKIDIGVEDIKSVTAEYFGISQSDLASNKKKRTFSYPRHLAMYLSRKYTHLSYHEIGDAFGHKNHSTVIYAIRRIEKSKKKEKKILDNLHAIENLLG